jgi:hypothetical protein
MQLSPTGVPPAARIGHAAVYNQTTNRMVVFGGVDQLAAGAGFEFNDVWVLSDADGTGGVSSWTQLFPTGTPPSPRAFHTKNTVYDQANNRMIVFGGDPNVGFCFGTVNDVWVLSNADGTTGTPAWIELLPTGTPPSTRGQGGASVYDPNTNRIITFGGSDACRSRDDAVWVITDANGLGSNPQWIQLSPIGTPGARSGHTAVYDPATNRMTVFGGQSQTSGAALNDLWVLENANGVTGTPTWTQLSPIGGPPSTSVGISHSAGYEPTTNRMVVIGSSGGLLNDVWLLENVNGLGGTPAWTQLSPTGTAPIGRGIYPAVFNPASNRMTVFGGMDTAASGLNDTWVLADVSGAVVEDCSNGIDDDGDGLVDCDDPDCLVDNDGDGFIAPPCGIDCDDNDSGNFPLPYYGDSDGDTYGSPTDITQACSQPAGYVTNNTDCDDGDATINPDATEVCNDGVDNDCDGLVDCDDSDCATDVNCVIESVDDVVNEIGLIDTSVLKNANMQNALLNKLNAVIAHIEVGNYADALAKLQNDILKKTDGCINSGAADKNDWVKDCDSQAIIYQAVLDAIAMVEGLL